MSESYIMISNNKLGVIALSSEVFVPMVITAISEVNGAVFDPYFTNTQKTLLCNIIDGELIIDVTCQIKFGYRIYLIAEKIQNRIKQEIAQGTGFYPKQVNVHISDLEF